MASATTGGGGGLSNLLGGGGVLSNVLNGAIKQGLQGGLIGGIMGAVTGQGFGKGFQQGGLGGAVSGGVMGGFDSMFAGPTGVDPMTTGSTASSTEPLVAANTATGAAANVVAPGSRAAGNAVDRATMPGYAGAANVGQAAPAASTAATAGGGLWKGLGGFLNSEAGLGLMGGIGEALTMERLYEVRREEAEAQRQYERENEQRISESYNVPSEALYTPYVDPNRAARPTPGQKWAYNPASGMIEMGA